MTTRSETSLEPLERKRKAGIMEKTHTSLARSALIGALAESTLLYPIELLKSRSQATTARTQLLATITNIAQTEGVRGFYKGCTPFTSQLVLKYFFRLSAFDFFRKQIRSLGVSDGASALSAGLCAGAAESMLIVTPLEVCKMQLALQKGRKLYKNMFHCLHNIAKEKGLRAIWCGGFPTFLRQTTNQGSLFFVAHKLNQHKNEWIPQPLFPFVTGVVAGSLGPLLNNSIDVVKSQRQAKMSVTTLSLPRHLAKIYREGGILALYKGAGLRVLRTGIGQGLMLSSVLFFNPNFLAAQNSSF